MIATLEENPAKIITACEGAGCDRKGQSKPKKDTGEAKLPHGWKLWRGKKMCQACMKTHTQTRAVTLTVEPADLPPFPAKDATKESREAYWKQRREHPFYAAAKAHFCAIAAWKTRVGLEFARQDPMEIETDGKWKGRLKAWAEESRKVVKEKLRTMIDSFPADNPLAIISGTEKWNCIRIVEEHYFGKSTQVGIPRRELAFNPKWMGKGDVRGERLATFAAPQPVPIEDDNVRNLRADGAGYLVDLRLGRTSWALCIPPGRRNDWSLGILKGIVAGEIEQLAGQLLPHPKVDTQLKISFRRAVETAAAKGAHGLVYVAVTPSDLIVMRREGRDENERLVWTGDTLRMLAIQQAVRQQRYGDDRKAERRGRQNDGYYARLENLSRTTAAAKKCRVNVIAYSIAARAARLRVETIKYDDRVRAGWPRLMPWYDLKRAIEEKCKLAGVAFVYLPDAKAEQKDKAKWDQQLKDTQAVADAIAEQLKKRKERKHDSDSND